MIVRFLGVAQYNYVCLIVVSFFRAFQYRNAFEITIPSVGTIHTIIVVGAKIDVINTRVVHLRYRWYRQGQWM
jgi:hypothetical protein